MRATRFAPNAWEDLQFWLQSDKETARRVARLISESQRTPFEGIGRPEPLKANLSGYWSRRITDEHRLVYRADDRELRIVSARYHDEQSKRSDLRITRAAPTRTPPRAWAAPRPAPASGAGAPG
ncbi:Txe/YoeB family addiction module toxin [Nocardiopsis lucentensis]|nr:Txe/YoeB family addiction module toxin [Nocardiopsis lucentensis]